MRKTNVTFTLSEEMIDKLDKLVMHYQQGSITKVTRTDVFRHMLSKEYADMHKNRD